MATPVNRSAPSLGLVILLAAPLWLTSSATLADEPAKAGVRTPTPAAVKIAVTSEHHLARAQEYKKKAAAYRAEAAVHHKMLADFIGQAKTERPDEDPERKEMRIHCQSYIEKAEALAGEAEKFADFHRMRAAELKGK